MGAVADVSGGRSTPTPDERCPDCGTELTADDWCSHCQKDPRPPVGDTTGNPDERPVRHSRDDLRRLDESRLQATQPQPTDDADWSDPSQIPSKSRKLSRRPSASGPDFVGAVAEIRALHQRMWASNAAGGISEWCTHDAAHWPCPTIAALDKAGCP